MVTIRFPSLCGQKIFAEVRPHDVDRLRVCFKIYFSISCQCILCSGPIRSRSTSGSSMQYEIVLTFKLIFIISMRLKVVLPIWLCWACRRSIFCQCELILRAGYERQRIRINGWPNAEREEIQWVMQPHTALSSARTPDVGPDSPQKKNVGTNGIVLLTW